MYTFQIVDDVNIVPDTLNQMHRQRPWRLLQVNKGLIHTGESLSMLTGCIGEHPPETEILS
jgi:hypothetical protein